MHLLLRYPINGVAVKFRVLVTNLTRGFIVRSISPSLHFFEAIPHLDRNPLWRCTFDRSNPFSCPELSRSDVVRLAEIDFVSGQPMQPNSGWALG